MRDVNNQETKRNNNHGKNKLLLSNNTLKYRKKTETLKGHIGGITSCRFSPNGKYICSTSVDQAAIIWDVNTSKRLVHLKKSTKEDLSTH